MTLEIVPGLAGVPVTRSSISFVDGKKGILEYRGIPIEALVKKSTFFETAYLLIHGSLPGVSALKQWEADFQGSMALRPDVVDVIEHFIWHIEPAIPFQNDGVRRLPCAHQTKQRENLFAHRKAVRVDLNILHFLAPGHVNRFNDAARQGVQEISGMKIMIKLIRVEVLEIQKQRGIGPFTKPDQKFGVGHLTIVVIEQVCNIFQRHRNRHNPAHLA